MTGTSWSIRRRLLVWLLGPLLLVSGIILVVNYFQARDIANAAYDRLLAASAQAIAERVVVTDGELEVDLPYVALDMLASTAQDRVFYQVSGPNGRLVTGYRDLPPPSGKISHSDGASLYYDAIYRGEPVRVAVLSRPLMAWGVEGNFKVHVAQTRGERDRLTQELVLASALRLLVVVVLAATITWFGISRGLAPLTQLRRSVRARSPQDLRPITQAVPREVRDLVEAINQLMARLEESLAILQRFIADASHQLRTPLAGLQAQIELALRERDPATLREALHRLHATTRRTSRLANQLLSLARTAPEVAGSASATLDLAELAMTVTRQAVPEAVTRDRDLGFEGQGPLHIHGDRLLLQELLKNLIDNALRYTPAQSRITVRVAPIAGGKALLEVEDEGPGIPPEERERVLDRFYRVPGSPGEGSGLGLAIVKEIADRHGAIMTLDSGTGGRGLRVRLVFPATVATTTPGSVVNPDFKKVANPSCRLPEPY